MIKLFYNIVDHQNAVRVTIRINLIKSFVLVCITMKHEKVHVSQQFFFTLLRTENLFQIFQFKKIFMFKDDLFGTFI